MLAMFIRIIKGPTLPDRVLALDAIGLQLMACVALYSVFIGSQYLLVVILLIGILAFLGTAVFSKFIDKGKVIERDSKIIISLAIIFIILGALISAITAIGIIRLKDVYSRGHAAGKSATLGAIFLLFGTFYILWEQKDTPICN